MSHPRAPLTMTARRRKVRRMIQRNPDLSARAIADQIGVSKDTVRRDLDAIRTTDAPDEPPTPAQDGVLVLALDEPLRQALAVLRATRGMPDTPTQNIAAARAAIRATADTVLDTHPEVAQ